MQKCLDSQLTDAGCICFFSGGEDGRNIWAGRITDDGECIDFLERDKRKAAKPTTDTGGSAWRFQITHGELHRYETPTDGLISVLRGLNLGMDDTLLVPSSLWKKILDADNKSIAPEDHNVQKTKESGASVVKSKRATSSGQPAPIPPKKRKQSKTVHAASTVDLNHDEICTMCLKTGKMFQCTKCPRSYHPSCIPAGLHPCESNPPFCCSVLGDTCTEREDPIFGKEVRARGRPTKTKSSAEVGGSDSSDIDCDGIDEEPAAVKKKRKSKTTKTKKKKKRKISSSAAASSLTSPTSKKIIPFSGGALVPTFFHSRTFPGGSSSSSAKSLKSTASKSNSLINFLSAAKSNPPSSSTSPSASSALPTLSPSRLPKATIGLKNHAMAGANVNACPTFAVRQEFFDLKPTILAEASVAFQITVPSEFPMRTHVH
jgi:hypothetical protein